MLIQRLEPGDRAEAIAELYLQSWRAAFGSILTPDLMSDEKVLAKGLKLSQAEHCFIAADGEVVVGVATVNGEELEAFYVDPAYWRTGAGELLHTHLSEVLNTAQLRLWVWEENERARRFYLRLGWERTETRRSAHFYGHDFTYEQWVRSPLDSIREKASDVYL